MGILWTVLLIAFAVLEMATVQLVSIWFAGGALGGLIAYLCGANEWLQVIVFAVVAGILLIVTKPLVQKLRKAATKPTNADSLIGTQVVISETVDNLAETGAARVKGVVWSVRNIDEGVIPEGTVVTVQRIEGVRLIVTQ